jgi:hypothetical protein
MHRRTGYIGNSRARFYAIPISISTIEIDIVKQVINQENIRLPSIIFRDSMLVIQLTNILGRQRKKKPNFDAR